MTVSRKNLTEEILSLFRKIARAAAKHGVDAYLVGGAVRDLLLRKKNLDLDFVLEAEAIEFAKIFSINVRAELTTYPDFKTATLKLKSGQRIDFSSARKEIYRKKGALPTVSLGSLQDDLFRRDFTINAMAMKISQSEFGELIDPFDGLNDLKNHKIRILHDKSFFDDPTRILRAIRYEQRLGFDLERHTSSLLKKAVNSNALNEISNDRYMNELRKVFNEPQVEPTLKRLERLKVFTRINHKLKVNFSSVDAIQRNLISNKLMRSKIGPAVWFLYFMGMLEGNNQDLIKNIISRFNFGKDNRISLLQLNDSQMTLKKLSLVSCQPSDSFSLLKNCTQDMYWYLWLRSANKTARKNMNRFLVDRKIGLNLNGEDIKKMGVKSGRQIGEIMDFVFKQKIDRRLKSREDELKMAKIFLENN